MATIPNYPQEAAAARQANASFFQAVDDIIGARATMDTLYRLRSEKRNGRETGLGPASAEASTLVASRLGDATHGAGMAAAYNEERAANGGMPAVDDVPATLAAVKADADAFWTKLEGTLPSLSKTLTTVPEGDGYRLTWDESAGSTIRDALQPEVGTLHASLRAAVGAE